jgi:hypothetical protein
MINSLGVFEHPQTLGLLYSTISSLSTMIRGITNDSKKEDIAKVISDLRAHFEVYQKISSEKDFHWRRDTMQYIEQL